MASDEKMIWVVRFCWCCATTDADVAVDAVVVIVIIVFVNWLAVMAYRFCIELCLKEAIPSNNIRTSYIHRFVRSSCILWHSAEYNYRLWNQTVRVRCHRGWIIFLLLLFFILILVVHSFFIALLQHYIG